MVMVVVMAPESNMEEVKFLADRRVVAQAVVQSDAFLAVGRRWHRPS